MRVPFTTILITALILLSTMPMALALQIMSAPIPSDYAYITGHVTCNGWIQDGVSVSITGGSSDTTRNEGYYKISVYPGLTVPVTASFMGVSVTKYVEAGQEGNVKVCDFSLTSPYFPAPTPTPLPPHGYIRLVGNVYFNDSPMAGVLVHVWPVTKVNANRSGHYETLVRTGQSLTVSVDTPTGVISRDVTSPTAGYSFVVDLDDAEPLLDPMSATPFSPSADSGPSPTASSTVTPTASAVPSGSEAPALLAAMGLWAAAGLLMLRRK